MAVICLGHSGNKFLGEQEMRNRIDVEDVTQLLLCLIENGTADTDSSIVDQNSWLPVLVPDFLCHRTDLLAVGDVEFIEMGIRR